MTDHDDKVQRDGCSSLCHPGETCAVTDGGVCDAKRSGSAMPFGWTPPAGLTVETPSYEPDCVMLGKAGVGWVTVDMRQRFFGLGYCRPRRWSGLDSCPGFTGRGWTKRLLTAASDHLLDEFPELVAAGSTTHGEVG